MLVKKITTANGELVHEFQPTVVRNIPVDEKFLKIIRQGMWMVVNGKKGTARAYKLKDVEFAGKTGTAQVVRIQKGKQEDLPVKFRDHAWFICFAPAENPQIAMVILVEHGMHGSSGAAPIAKYILERLYTPQDFLVKHDDSSPGM
jgi:penicillin-binding protein 2